MKSKYEHKIRNNILILIILQITIFQCISIAFALDDSTFDEPSSADISASVNNLYINEIMADNDNTLISDSGSYDDWIELYNANDYALNLSNLYITDSLNTKTLWKFPNDTIIEANGYLIIFADGFLGIGTLNLPFKLSANGDFVAIIAEDGITIIDSISFGKQIRDTSYGRSSDGDSDWVYMTTPTPNEANVYVEDDQGVLVKSLYIVVAILGLSLLIWLFISKRINFRRNSND